MKKKVLIVEDDEYFRDTISDVLKDKYKVILAPTGKAACEILALQEIDAVLSDIQMPGMSGIELLEWSKTNRPVPFILMTGFSTLLETKSAFEMGANAFIVKPFKINDLISNLNTVLELGEKPKDTVDPRKDMTQYCKVSIDEFVSKPKIDFDVYIKLSDTNIIKIANKNQALPREQVDQYKSKGLKYLYIHRDDFSKLVHFNLDLAKMMKDRNEISQDKKMSFIKYTGEVILEKTFTDGMDNETLQDASSFVKLAVGSVTDSQENLDLLNILNSHADRVYADSIGVSLYSVLIAKQMGFEASSTLFKLSMAGLFHDVGKKEIDKELLAKPRHLVTREERKIIESHVVRSYEILNTMRRTMPTDVAQLVYEHHEDLEGLGYPLRKSKREQHPLSRVLQCANIFLEQVNEIREEGGKIVPANIIEHIEKIYDKRVDPACLKALRQIFRCDNSL